MSWKTKAFPFVFVLVGLFAGAARGEENASHFTYARLYCSPDGNSHFQDVTVELRKTNFALPAPPIHIGSDFAASKAFFGGFDAGWALTTWRIASTIPHRQLNSASFCKASFPSPRPTEKRDDCGPAASFGWRTPRPAKDISPSWAMRLDS
jgi:hypothetical protein